MLSKRPLADAGVMLEIQPKPGTYALILSSSADFGVQLGLLG
jgi:hypothetical protein